MLKNKLLLVSPIPPPVGGIASWSINILSYYKPNFSDWDIIHQNTAIRHHSITNKGFIQRLIGGYKNSWKIINEFNRNIISIWPDVIHITSSGSFALIKDLFLIRIAKKKCIPVVIHFHFGRIPLIVKRNGLEWSLLKLVINNCKMVIVIDQQSYNSLKDAGIKNVVNIPNPISKELEVRAQKKIYKNLNSKIKILFVGHIIPKKGIYELLEACNLIPNIDELILIGPYENSIANELKNIAKKRDNGKWLTILGSLERSEILDYMADVTLLALPSYTEGFPNVIIEAMAMGCPIVATDVGAIPDMLGVNTVNNCGICVKPRKIDELRLSIQELINNKDYSKMIGKNGNIKVLNEYTLLKITKLYESVWQNAL